MLKAPILFFWWHLKYILTTSSWGGNDTDNYIQTETVLEQHILRKMAQSVSQKEKCKNVQPFKKWD